MSRRLLEQLYINPRIYTSSETEQVIRIPKATIEAVASTSFLPDASWIFYDNGIYPEVYTRNQIQLRMYDWEPEMPKVQYKQWPE